MQVVVLNGLLGNRKKYLDVTEVVDQVAFGDMGLPRNDPQCLSIRKGRGGAGPVAFKQLFNRVVDGAKNHDTLLLIGKSYGGHWCVKLLERMAETNKLGSYKRVGLLTVDPSFVLHKMQRKVVYAPPVDYAVNVHQFGPRSGYRLGPPAKNITVHAAHKDIELRPQVKAEVQSILEWGVLGG